MPSSEWRIRDRLAPELTEYQQQCLGTVKAAAENLLTIINDLLDFAKIEAGKLELDLADFSLHSAVGETLRSLAVRAHKKGMEIIYHVHPRTCRTRWWAMRAGGRAAVLTSSATP